MGPRRFIFFILNHGPSVHHPMKCSSTSNVYCSLVPFSTKKIHDKHNSFDKNLKDVYCHYSEISQVTVLLQQLHTIKMSVTSSSSNLNFTLKK